MNDEIVSVDDLYSILGDNAAIADKSSLSKLQDTFPLEIFNFQVLSQVIDNCNFNLAFYMFPICCWNEAYNNQIVGKQTRLFLLECAIYGFKKFYELQKQRNNKKIIMPRIAIKRAFVAVVIVYTELKQSEGIFNFALFGTMLQEHYHALIRGMARGVDTLANTMSCIEKSSIVYNIQCNQGTKNIKRTRFSVGGTHFNPDIHIDKFECNLNPLYIIEKLKRMSAFGNHQDFDELFCSQLNSFISTVGEGSLRITSENKNFHIGRRILSREITNSNEAKKMMEIADDITDIQLEEIYNEDNSHQFQKDIETLMIEEEEEEEKAEQDFL